MCRSISGSVPLPIEPKPIITIGPSKRACSGPFPVTGAMVFISTTPARGTAAGQAARGAATGRWRIGALRPAPPGRRPRMRRARRRGRRRSTRRRAGGAARRVRATTARRSSRSRSRSARSRARRRPAAPRGGPAVRPSCKARRTSIEPMPRLRQSGWTASGPSSSAGRSAPADTCQSRTVPTIRRPSTATNDSASAGRIPSRRRCEGLEKRAGP